MEKTFATSRVNNIVVASFNQERTYNLSFGNDAEAQLFMSELSATQDDFWTNGKDNCVRRKAIFANPADCSVSMNFNSGNTVGEWPMKAVLASVEEMNNFYADVKYAIYGPMPGI